MGTQAPTVPGSPWLRPMRLFVMQMRLPGPGQRRAAPLAAHRQQMSSLAQRWNMRSGEFSVPPPETVCGDGERVILKDGEGDMG